MATGQSAQPRRGNEVSALAPMVDVDTGEAQVWGALGQLADQVIEAQKPGQIRRAQQKGAKEGQEAAAFGPGGQAAADLYEATAGNVVSVSERLRKGDDLGEAVERADIGRDLVDLPRRWVPGSNLWFARAAWNRAVLDQLQRIVDPEAEEDFARRSKRMERENGQGQWWPNGAPAPGRAPDPGNALAPVE